MIAVSFAAKLERLSILAAELSIGLEPALETQRVLTGNLLLLLSRLKFLDDA